MLIAKMYAILSDKFNKFAYLTGEEMLPWYQSSVIEQALFAYYP